MNFNWNKYRLSTEVVDLLTNCPEVNIISSVTELFELACGAKDNDYFEVTYDVPGQGTVVEATVARVRNGIVANYPEPYMRRRDPDCMLIGDNLATNKESYQQRFGHDFQIMREETLAWLRSQRLVVFGFIAGRPEMGVEALVIAPANAGFFAFGLALLQGIISQADLPDNFSPKAIIYVAPVFRHTHFQGKQVVVHHRQAELHEIFSYNLYPGPSAKKGVYGVLINLGEQEGWVTAHCSTAQVITPYDNVVTFMHEGASGSGKSEMLEQAHREVDGRLLLGENTITGEKRFLEIPRSCEIHAVTDDMALCHPSLQTGDGKMVVTDAEDAWFVRVNHITHYGTDIPLEKLTAEPPIPLLFLNIDAVPKSRALIWEHIQDAPNTPCPNPRVVIPREIFPKVVTGGVSVDIRSFGVRTPPCTKEHPTYGMIGLFHILPPALAWLWRLVAPRGHANPSIVETQGMGSEGVGSYWPFATGRKVDQANLLLQQFTTHLQTRYILCPNQHVGAWRVNFMSQWVAREYLARRGVAKFKPGQLIPARCSLLGYTLSQLLVEGRQVPTWLLHVEHQLEVGEAAYDEGANILHQFFNEHLVEFLKEDDLLPLGKQIIQICLQKGALQDYEACIPMIV